MKHHEDIIKAIFNRYNFLGSGKYAVTFNSCDDKYITKWSFYDMGYREFLRYVFRVNNLSYKKNRHLPIIKKVIVNKCICYVKMEKLIHLSGYRLNQYLEVTETVKRFITKRQSPISFTHLKRIFNIKLFDQPKLFIETYYNLLHFACLRGISPDLHGHNIMQRQDGCLVFTDPFQD